MSIDIAATRARVIALPGSTGVDIALGLLAEVERLREEAHEMRLWAEEAARAENANADDAKKERAAVVAWLEELSASSLNHNPVEELLYAARSIERGEHRREEGGP